MRFFLIIIFYHIIQENTDQIILKKFYHLIWFTRLEYKSLHGVVDGLNQ